MKNISTRFFAGLIVTSVFMTSCGKKKDGSNDEAPPYVGAIALGSQAINYGMGVLASTNRTSPSAALTSIDTDFYAEGQDSALQDCSEHGSPWDRTTNAVMDTSNAKYSQTVFYCQTNSRNSSDTLAGSLMQYKRVLCDAERVLGSIEYTSAGKIYSNVAMSTTEACGWPANEVRNGLSATITAFAPSSGDWQKRLKIVIGNAINYDLSYTIKSDIVAFKAVESWSQSARQQDDDFNSSISSTATGSRGSVVTIDVANGILRAEAVDTYWSRRFRFYMKGTLDGSTGMFTNISNGQGIVADFNYQNGFSGKAATATGSDINGFLHGTYQYNGTLAAPRSATVTSATKCSTTNGCVGQTAISLGTETSDFDFLMIGAVWDSQTNSRNAVQDWLASAGFLTFTSVSKANTL